MASVATPVPEQKTTREPKNSKFTQQDLPALKPLLTPVWVAAVFFGIAIVFIPIGAACLAASAGVVEVSARYDDSCISGDTHQQRDTNLVQLEGVGTTCNVTLTAPRHMKPPIYLYYELDNYYQNHRRYVKSRSDSQLRGTGDNLSSTSDCDPEQVLQADTSKLIMPCGLIAWSYFNDTYAVTADIGGTATAVAVDETGIAWESDIKHKFGSQAAQYFNLQEYAAYRGGNTITGALNADEHFINPPDMSSPETMHCGTRKITGTLSQLMTRWQASAEGSGDNSCKEDVWRPQWPLLAHSWAWWGLLFEDP
ncbi:hypothetical protein WJX82_003650 [Trebouxia sp. C0006]